MSELKSDDPSLIGVYCIVSPNGSRYVGATTVSFKARWSDHVRLVSQGNHHCMGLQRAFTKYGAEAMTFEILEAIPRTSDETVWLREKFWWNKIKLQGVNLYNGEPTGTGSVIQTVESREKLSRSLKEKADTKLEPLDSKIRDMAKSDQFSFEDILRMAPVGTFALRRYMKQNGIISVPKTSPNSKVAIELYLTGSYSTGTLSKMLGISQPAVYNILKRSKDQRVLDLMKLARKKPNATSWAVPYTSPLQDAKVAASAIPQAGDGARN